jgi:copper chaperone CopZ
MSTQDYLVTGMTCGHCADSVRRGLTAVPGVADVTVDVAAGAVTVAGTDLDDALLRAAITGAGYEVATPVAL